MLMLMASAELLFLQLLVNRVISGANMLGQSFEEAQEICIH